MIITRQLQHIAASPAGEFAGEHEKVASDCLDSRCEIVFRQTEPLEPMHQVIGEQQHLKELYIRGPFLRWNFVKGQMIEKLSDRFLDIGARVVVQTFSALRFRLVT